MWLVGEHCYIMTFLKARIQISSSSTIAHQFSTYENGTTVIKKIKSNLSSPPSVVVVVVAVNFC